MNITQYQGTTQDARNVLQGFAPIVAESGGGVDGGSGVGGVPLKNIFTLHALCANLILTKNILLAASSWDAIDSLRQSLSITSGNLAQAASALITPKNGNKSMQDMPGQKDSQRLIKVFLKHCFLAALQTAQRVGSGGKSGKLDPL